MVNLKNTIPTSVALFNFLIKFLGWTSFSLLAPIIVSKFIFKSLAFLNRKAALSNRLKDKVVLITGASSGLGATFSNVLQSRECKLILCSRNEQKLQELKQNLIHTYNIPAHLAPHLILLDLEDLNSIPTIVQNALKIHGHIDILINNAGISYRGNAASTDLAVDIKLMNVNYFGHVAITKAVLPNMIERRQGHIISIGSIQSKVALPYRSCYAASKHALQAFMDCLRAEVARENIQVLMVLPGYINTNLSYNAITQDGKTYGRKDKAISELISPIDVAEQVVEALLAGGKEIAIGSIIHKAAVWLRVMMPDFFFYLMKKRSSSSSNFNR